MADSWVEAAAAALARFDGQHARKKRDTVIALVDARLSGRPEESVWELPQACSRTIYHTKWKHDEVFSAVLAEVFGVAQHWQDTRALRALQSAAERMALASPVAAAKLIGLMNADDAAIVLRAATAILDRAGVETAQKQTSETHASIDVRRLDELTDEELAAIAMGGSHG